MLYFYKRLTWWLNNNNNDNNNNNNNNNNKRLSGWQNCPTHTVAGMFELYEQLLPTRLYASQKMGTDLTGVVTCRLCDKVPESVPHVLAGCTAMAQNKYLTRHNAALKIIFFEIVYDLGLIASVPPWYSPVKPKPVYESDSAEAFWDVPVFVVHEEVTANRVDAGLSTIRQSGL